jgi:putative FmdB family regulatory protein
VLLIRGEGINMITYSYECPECKLEVEYKHKITETPEYKCPWCASKDKEVIMERIIVSNGAFILKGGCWARDGYKK